MHRILCVENYCRLRIVTVFLCNNLKKFGELTEPNQENPSVENSLRCVNVLQYTSPFQDLVSYTSHLTKEKQKGEDKLYFLIPSMGRKNSVKM